LSCSDDGKNKAELEADSINKTARKDSIAKIPINCSLPFGCSILDTFSFPERWERDLNDSSLNILDIEFNSLIKCFNVINEKKPIEKPFLGELEYLKLFNYSIIPFDSTLIESIDNIIYRLPDMELYECYYIFKNTYEAYKQHSNYCSEYGNLLLYNKETKKSKIINVYLVVISEVSEFRRFFYITNGNSIEIFESTVDELETSFKKKYNISIDPKGEVLLKASK
jgi:hypothetical protein